MSRCVVCGKEFKRAVSDAHIKSHKISKRKYKKMAGRFSEDIWDLYWTSDLCKKFLEPCNDKVSYGRFANFAEWVKGSKPEGLLK